MSVFFQRKNWKIQKQVNSSLDQVYRTGWSDQSGAFLFLSGHLLFSLSGLWVAAMRVHSVLTKLLRVMRGCFGTTLVDVLSMYFYCYVLLLSSWSVSSLEFQVFCISNALNNGSMIIIRWYPCIGVAFSLASVSAGGVFLVFLGVQKCYSLSSPEAQSSISFVLSLAGCWSVTLRWI